MLPDRKNFLVTLEKNKIAKATWNDFKFDVKNRRKGCAMPYISGASYIEAVCVIFEICDLLLFRFEGELFFHNLTPTASEVEKIGLYLAIDRHIGAWNLKSIRNAVQRLRKEEVIKSKSRTGYEMRYEWVPTKWDDLLNWNAK